MLIKIFSQKIGKKYCQIQFAIFKKINNPSPEHMTKRLHRRDKEHQRTRETHHIFNPLTHHGLIAMNGTFATRGFLFTKRTFRQSGKGILLQFCTLGAQISLGMVFPFAVKRDHERQDALFLLYF